MVTRRAMVGGALAMALGLATRRAAGDAAVPAGWVADGRFRTPWFARDAAASGPTVVVVAGLHGNETAPPRAARALLDLELASGRLVVLPEANAPALAARSRYVPGERFADVNRNFPTGARRDPRGALARAVWALILGQRPALVLDLHEGWGFSKTSASMGSSVVVAPEPSGRAEDLAARALDAVNATVAVEAKRFTRIGPGPAGSLARALAERSVQALVFETTWTEPMEVRVAQQLRMVRAVLAALGSIRDG
jgi:predicted deacylase